MRAVGVDFGSRRIGIAVSDSGGLIASPYEVLERSGDTAADHRRINALVDELYAERVVVGLPLSLDGTSGPAAQAIAEEAAALADVVSVPLELHDERFTTVTADRSLMQLKMKADARRRVVDKVAAAVMLQSWLDARKARGND